MPGPLDNNDFYWVELRKSPAFARAWNAALWEAWKLFDDCPPLSKEEVAEALRNITINE